MYQAFGAIPSKKDVRDYKIATSSAPVEFPEEFELNMPAVKYQGSVGSCVAHSIALVVEYFSRKQGDANEEFSTGYIYGNRTNMGYDGTGLVTRTALQNTCKYGDVVKKLLPYNEEVPSAIERFNEMMPELFPQAYPYRFSSYFSCKREDDMKKCLMAGNPIIFVIHWYNDIYVDKNGVMHSTQNSQNSTSCHCMVIYGWNKTGWKIQNSWGTIWGIGGRAILPYDFEIVEAYGILDDISERARANEIDSLRKQNTQLLEDFARREEQMNKEIERLQEVIKELAKEGQDCSEEVKKLNLLIKKMTDEKLNYLAKIDELQEQINKLEAEKIELKKPFHSFVGKIFAKIANFFINLFHKK